MCEGPPESLAVELIAPAALILLAELRSCAKM